MIKLFLLLFSLNAGAFVLPSLSDKAGIGTGVAYGDGVSLSVYGNMPFYNYVPGIVRLGSSNKRLSAGLDNRYDLNDTFSVGSLFGCHFYSDRVQ